MNTEQFEPVESDSPLHATTSGEITEMVPLILTLKNILVPIDFSATSLKALQYAVPFAKQFEAKITLLHVVDLPMYPQEFGYLLVDESQAMDGTKKSLADLATRMIAPELLAQTIVRRGLAWDTVVAVARETQADLIITTTHGYTGLKHVLMGSTAERIVRHAPCPVLVVREKEHEFVLPPTLRFTLADFVSYFSTALKTKPSASEDRFVFTGPTNDYPEDVFRIAISAEAQDLVVAFSGGGDYGLTLAREFFEAPFFTRDETPHFFTLLEESREAPASAKLPCFTVRFTHISHRDDFHLTLRFTPAAS